jgi:oligoribonuclease NrnB/cAMP/cGMP phosphodiesterase (DHH superfamily)
MVKISLDAKILNISHSDLDGAGCSIILANVFKNIEFNFCQYYNIDRYMEVIDYSQYDFVIITDVHPEKEASLDLSDKIILIDHHQSPYHNPAKNRYVISDKGVSATKLVMHWCEQMYDVSLSHLYMLMKYINDYDMWILKYPKSKMLNDLLFHKYKCDGFLNAFLNGRVTFTKEERVLLIKLNNQFNELYDNLVVHPIGRIKGCIVFQYEFINEVASKLMTSFDEIDLVVITDIGKRTASVRTTSEEVNLGMIFQNLKWDRSGGHPKTAGFYVEDGDDFERKMLMLEAYIFDNFESMRK